MKNKSKKIMIAVCLVVLIAVFAGLLFFGGKDEPVQDPPATRSDLLEEFEEAHTTPAIKELESVDNEGWGELIPLK